tara:strand:- start:60 stop:1040 length:981 start_codon:yes stop_codon:yes gene_type:complete
MTKPLIIILRLITNLPFLIYEILILLRVFSKIKPDIIHLNSGGYPPTMSVKAAIIAAHFFKAKKLILVVNNLAENYNSLSRVFDMPLDRVIVKYVDIFVTGSKAAKNRLKNVLSLDEKKIMNIHNGISLRKSQENIKDTRKRLGLIKKNIKVFGIVGLLIPRKGHMVLINSIELLVKNNVDNFVVLIEGEGYLKKKLEQEVISKGLNKYCIFIGHENNIIDFISAVDFIIFPSIANEDFPNVILEAMGLGKIVIASKLSGIPEQITDGKTGFLFDPGDEKALAKLMIKVIAEKHNHRLMELESINKFKSFFTDIVSVKKYISLYEL